MDWQGSCISAPGFSESTFLKFIRIPCFFCLGHCINLFNHRAQARKPHYWCIHDSACLPGDGLCLPEDRNSQCHPTPYPGLKEQLAYCSRDHLFYRLCRFCTGFRHQRNVPDENGPGRRRSSLGENSQVLDAVCFCSSFQPGSFCT